MRSFPPPGVIFIQRETQRGRGRDGGGGHPKPHSGLRFRNCEVTTCSQPTGPPPRPVLLFQSPQPPQRCAPLPPGRILDLRREAKTAAAPPPAAAPRKPPRRHLASGRRVTRSDAARAAPLRPRGLRWPCRRRDPAAGAPTAPGDRRGAPRPPRKVGSRPRWLDGC